MQMGKVSEITYKRSVKKKLSSDLEGTRRIIIRRHYGRGVF